MRENQMQKNKQTKTSEKQKRRKKNEGQWGREHPMGRVRWEDGSGMNQSNQKRREREERGRGRRREMKITDQVQSSQSYRGDMKTSACEMRRSPTTTE